MVYFLYTLIELIYYSFLALTIGYFNNLYMSNSAWILMFFSVLLGTTLLFLINLLKNRRKYFIISSIYIILICSIFYLFGAYILNILNIKTGLINFTMYLYKILFMLSPFLSIYFLGIHKLTYTIEKKYVCLIIAFRRIIEILVIFIFLLIANFSTILYILAIIDFLLNFYPILLFQRKFKTYKNTTI